MPNICYRAPKSYTLIKVERLINYRNLTMDVNLWTLHVPVPKQRKKCNFNYVRKRLNMVKENVTFGWDG